MKITFPHMGNLSIVAKALFEALGQEVIVAPKCTKKTLSIGVKTSPEGTCLPFKINMGNYIEAAELGADTVVMTGGCGPCRFGYFGEVQQEILRDLGYDLNVVVLEVEENGWEELRSRIKFLANGKSYLDVFKALRFAWHKAKALDIVEEEVQRKRAVEAVFGKTDKVYERACKRIDKAQTVREIYAVVDAAFQQISRIPQRLNADVIRIAIVGEIYTVLEPFANLNLEKHLGKMGVETIRSLYLSQWANDHLFKGILNARSAKKYHRKAAPYLTHFVGGHAVETVGSAVYFAEDNYDGIIQIAPLTCMPEIVAQSILPHFSSKNGIPLMTIYVDEQTGEAGLITRLEAFCDLIRQRRKNLKKESV